MNRTASTLPLLLPLLITVCGSCAGGTGGDPLLAPFAKLNDSVRRVGPELLHGDLDHAGRRTAQLVAAEPARLPDAAARSTGLVDREARHLQALPRRGATLAAGELQHLGKIRWQAVTAELAPENLGPTLSGMPDKAVRVLHLDRPIMAEIDDPHHRTDPDDLEPPAGWWDRLLRRIWR